ncbi:lysostaphin resistance A-like protein [Paraconexibacter sp.]|uniref:CPBP family intramembrane glutamic endopeptidase n=1 Tax=Paraconexibacter sp. TaxID=2949640 RepID=UPI00356A4A12
MTDRSDDPADPGDRPSVPTSGPPGGLGTAPPPLLPELPEGVEPGIQRPRWKPWTAFVALILGFVAASVGYVFIAGGVAAFGGSFEDPPAGVTISATYVQDTCLILAAVFFAATVARPRPWQFGLRPVGWGAAVGWTTAAFFGFIIFSAIWSVAFDLGDEEDTLPTELGVDESTAALIAVALLVTVVAPIAEEFFFRGFFFRALANWRGIWPAAVITGITFGAIHAGGSPVGFLVPLGVFGFVLCLLYAKTQSLYPPIVLHAINNSIAFGTTQDWDWQIPVLLACALAVIAACAFVVRRAFGPAPPRPLPV